MRDDDGDGDSPHGGRLGARAHADESAAVANGFAWRPLAERQ
jgi:hypothetical protein